MSCWGRGSTSGRWRDGVVGAGAEVVAELARRQAAVDGAAALPGALFINWDFWSAYYSRPNGEVLQVGADPDRPDDVTVHTDCSSVLRVLVWGRRFPELAELIPARPAGAVDCRCRQVPLLASGKVLCHECGALGWLPADGTLGGGA